MTTNRISGDSEEAGVFNIRGKKIMDGLQPADRAAILVTLLRMALAENGDPCFKQIRMIEAYLCYTTAKGGQVHLMEAISTLCSIFHVDERVLIAYLIMACSEETVSINPSTFTISFNWQKVDKELVVLVQKVVDKNDNVTVSKDYFAPEHVRVYKSPYISTDGKMLTEELLQEQEKFRDRFSSLIEHGYINNPEVFFNS